MSFLITGANGFVGNRLMDQLHKLNLSPRSLPHHLFNNSMAIDQAMQGVTTVFHLAARVHVMHENASDPLAEFRAANVKGTQQLIEAAIASGVKRFVYVSTIKVNGDRTLPGQFFSEHDTPAPQDDYAQSKWEAEQLLLTPACQERIETVIIRPPLVYGTGVKGNFSALLSLVRHNVPLPFASINNQRDLVYLDNLVGALIQCATHPAAAGKTYLVSDGCSISTPALIDCLASSMGLPKRTFRCPPKLLRLVAKIAGKSAQAERLLDSLQIDSDKIRRELGWIPPYTLQQGLQLTAQAYLAKQK